MLADALHLKRYMILLLRIPFNCNHQGTTSKCNALFQALVGHCEAWRANFTGLLNSIALKELQALHECFENNSAALRRPPTNLDTLAEAVQLHRKLTLDKPAIQARFEPLHDKYKTLEKFEVRLSCSFCDLSDGCVFFQPTPFIA